MDMDPDPHPELLNTLLALLAISLASLLGSVSFAFGKRLQTMLPYLLASASGILIATAVTHLLPEAIERVNDVRRATVLFLIGVIGSFLLERLFALGLDYSESTGHMHEVAVISGGRSLVAGILVSGAVHSFVDGVTIAVAFAVGHQIGVATTVAVFLHEVPHHIANVGVLLYAGMSRGRAALMNMAATSGCALGGVLILFSGLKSPAFTFSVLPIAAGNFLYIGLAILLPEMSRERGLRRSVLQTTLFVAAATVMTALSFWEPV